MISKSCDASWGQCTTVLSVSAETEVAGGELISALLHAVDASFFVCRWCAQARKLWSLLGMHRAYSHEGWHRPPRRPACWSAMTSRGVQISNQATPSSNERLLVCDPCQVLIKVRDGGDISAPRRLESNGWLHILSECDPRDPALMVAVHPPAGGSVVPFD